MKSGISGLLLSVAVLLSASPLVGTAQAQDDKVTLVIANSQWLDAMRGEKLWAAVKQYEKVAPNVTLEQEAIPSKDYADRLITEMSAGQGPDLAIVQDGLFYPIADAGFLIPVDDVVGAAEGLNETNSDGVVDGVALGVAWQRAVYALIYNKALIEKSSASVPSNVDELITQAKGVSSASGAIGFTTRHSMSEVTNWFKDFQNWVYGYGGSWVDADGKLKVNSPAAVEATDAFKKVYDSGIIPLGDPMTQQRTRFKEGQVAFSIDNSGGTLNITSGGTLASTDMAAAPLPFPHPGAHQQIFVGISAHSEHPDEAKAFLSWMLSPEGQQALRDASGPDALATDVPVTAEFAAENPWAPVFAELAANSRSTLIPGYEVETAAIMRIVMDAVERVLITGVPAQEALDAAQAEVERRY